MKVLWNFQTRRLSACHICIASVASPRCGDGTLFKIHYAYPAPRIFYEFLVISFSHNCHHCRMHTSSYIAQNCELYNVK